MNAPTKCEAARRAVIKVTDIVELEQLSDSVTILHKEFSAQQWSWFVVVDHPALALIVPGQYAKEYQSVEIFNRAVSAMLAQAMAGKAVPSPDEEQAVLAKAQYQQLMQYYSAQQKQAQAPSFGLGLTTPGVSSLGQFYGISPGYTTTTSGTNTP